MAPSNEAFRKACTEEAKKLAESKGGKCLSEYIKTRISMTWVCKKGHTWDAELSRIRRGHWCKKCSDGVIDISDAQKHAESKGGKCLSENYVPCGRTRLLWECDQGHTWEAFYSNVVHKGSWCPVCNKARFQAKISKEKTVRLELARKIALERGGECLSTDYVPKLVILDWRCKNGHEWSARFRCVNKKKNPTWCPKCRWKNQEICREIFEEILGLPTPRKRGLFSNYRLELDGYVEIHGVKIAWEYQGQQHYQKVSLFGSHDPEKQQKLDQQKRDECKTLGIHLIEIPYTVKNKKEFIREKITETFLNLPYEDISDDFVELTGYLIERGILPDPDQDE